MCYYYVLEVTQFLLSRFMSLVSNKNDAKKVCEFIYFLKHTHKF